MSDRDDSKTSRKAIAYAVLLFFSGFLMAAAVLHLAVGSPLALYGAERSEKLEIMRRGGYAYSSAMFGSSHVHLGFDPRAFDTKLAGTAIAVRSFNLGVDGGALIEERTMSLDFLDHLKAPTNDRPCLIMLEASAEPAFSTLFTQHPRQINILDKRSTEIVLQFPPDGYKLPNQIHRRLLTLTSAFYHAINMGMLSDRIFRPPFNEDAIRTETENDKRGIHYVASNEYTQRSLAQAFSQRRYPPTPIEGKVFRGFDSIMSDLHNAPNGDRAQLIWVVMPVLKDLVEYKIYPQSEEMQFGEVPILDLGRPDLYPELYDPSLWLDSQHLNPEGASVFSSLLAQQVLTWSQRHPMHACGG